jgi:hypothetical protein
MSHGTSCPDGHWCSRADALFDVDGIHVTSVVRTGNGLLLHVESDQTLNGCPACGVVAVGHGRRRVRLHDVPAFGQPVRLVWAKRVWRCPEPVCPTGTFTETHPLAKAKAKLTTRAVAWATDALDGPKRLRAGNILTVNSLWHPEQSHRMTAAPWGRYGSGNRLFPDSFLHYESSASSRRATGKVQAKICLKPLLTRSCVSPITSDMSR